MASINAATTTSAFVRTAVPKPAAVSGSASPVLGLLPHVRCSGLLPQLRVKGANVRCSAWKNEKGAAASLVAAAASMTGGPALALVDERMSTEGTGLSLGISNNLLGWILLGVFALIWSLYIVYTSGLEEDEESGLSL